MKGTVIPASRSQTRSLASLLVFATVSVALSTLEAFPGEKASSQALLFRDAALEAGLEFQHFTGASGEFFFPEIMGPGAALLDYDGDGDLDVYFVQGTLLDKSKSPNDSLFPPPSGRTPHNQLFRSELKEEGRLRFTEVAVLAGVADDGFGMGAAVGDYDNDGDADLYVTNFGSNVLYRNNGDGTFTNVTLKAGVDDVRWNTSAAFLDYDKDGDLDLFVAAYLDFTVKGNIICRSLGGMRDYCTPLEYQPLPDRLFRNEGDGSFTNVTGAAGMRSVSGKGLGVVCFDVNADGWTDIYVANDRTANQLWINLGNGTFEETALVSGTAYNADGTAESSMGVTAGDFDNDGDEDLFMTHLITETNTLYLNDGTANCQDATRQFGLARDSFAYTGFGTEWFDYDNDGSLDLFVANGAVFVVESQRGERYPYRQKNQLFHNESEGKFRETTTEAGPALEFSEVSRSAAFGDVDNDGDVDIVVGNNNGPARLLLNETGSRQHWLQVRLRGVKSNREGMGARVGVLRKGRKPLWRRAHTDGSYLSANDGRVHFGLGENSDLEAVVVEWPGGKEEVWSDIRADQILTLREGSGKKGDSHLISAPAEIR